MIHCFSRAMVASLLLVTCATSHANVNDEAAAASLLAAPDEDGWNLESMMAAARAHRISDDTSGHEPVEEHPERFTQDSEKRTLRRQVQSLRKALERAQHELAEREPISGSNDSDELKRIRSALQDSEHQVATLNQHVENLKAALAERDKAIRKFGGSQDTISQDLAQKTAALEQNSRELASLRAELVRKDTKLASLAPPPGEKDRVESLTLALEDRDKALASALSQADESRAALDRLKSEIQKKEKVTKDLTAALDVRSQELKEAATSLADLRAKRAPTIPATPQQKQAYVAGLMMADGLNRRLESWAQAGVKTDMGLFRSGLEDGLAHTLRLKAPEASRVQAAFMKAVQNGVARQVTDAQKRLDDLAKGRDALKSENGITWYRERAGKTVTPGHAVKLSMTERVVGGREVSRVPALTLRPGDNVPAVVRDGMYLPGVGGEVVAYALARDVYGELPLPAGVQPWTVMEYHLKGEPQTTR
ncbi:hypothetical protein SNN83_004412 [Cronobacter malonaticus]|nr:hypothetical protein [Cronobacter malonaticus]